MVKVNIDGKNRKIPTHWDDVTLSQCDWLYKFIHAHSEELREYYIAFASGATPPLPENKDELITFSKDALHHIANIPHDTLNNTEDDNIMALSAAVLPRFVLGMLGFVECSAKERTSFRFKRYKYMMPSSGTDISGRPTPLSRLSAIELCQLSDIVCSGNISLAHLACAIVCRKRGEAYNEMEVSKRADIFKELPASIFWELWSAVSSAHDYLRKEHPECYPKEGDGGGSKSSTKPSTWCDTLVSLATDKPSDLEYLQRMNGYDFVHLLCESIKKDTEKWKMNAMLSFGKRM